MQTEIKKLQKPQPRPIFIPPTPVKDIRFVYMLIKEGYSENDAFAVMGYSPEEIEEHQNNSLIKSASLQRKYILNQEVEVLDIEPIEVVLTHSES